ncbi:tetratricopeptide repeat protein, partial [bacterium]
MAPKNFKNTISQGILIFTLLTAAVLLGGQSALCVMSPDDSGDRFIWNEISREFEPAGRFLLADISPSHKKGYSGEFEDASEAFAKGDFDSALFGFIAAASSLNAEEGAEASFWVGEARRRAGKTDTAIVAFGKARGELRDEALFRRAVLCDVSGRIEEARRYFGEIAQQKDSAHRAEALTWMGRDHFASGKKEEALKEVELAAALGGPAKADALYLKGLLLADSGQPADAEKVLTGAIMDFPDHALAKLAKAALGWLFLGEGNYEAARRRFLWALEGGASGNLEYFVRYGLVKTAALEGKADEALSHLEALAKSGADQRYMAAAWSRLGASCKKAGDFQKSLWAYEKALEVCPACEGADEARFSSGEDMAELGMHSAAADALLKVSKDSTLAPKALIKAAEEDIKSGNSLRAIASLKEARSNYPSYEGIHRAAFLLGEALKGEGDGAGAWKAYESVPPATPSYLFALWELAAMAHEEENYDRSSRLFAKFIANFPQDPKKEKAISLLAEAELNRGDLKAASAAYSELERGAVDPLIREEALY